MPTGLKQMSSLPCWSLLVRWSVMKTFPHDPGTPRRYGVSDIVDPDGKFVRHEVGVIVFNFSDHSGKTVDEVARRTPVSSIGCSRKLHRRGEDSCP